MLVVTGTQRSGTSLIAECFIKMGYDLGSDLWDEEALGGYENETICAFYRKYLGDARFPFDDFKLPEPKSRYVLNEEFSGLGLPVVKYSYLLMNPAFVTIWHKFRADQEDVFLVMNRNKEDVIRSKRRMSIRFQHDSWLLQQTPDALTDNFVIGLGYLESFYKTAVLNFPEYLESLPKVNAALYRLNPKMQIPERIWNLVVDKSKVHF